MNTPTLPPLSSRSKSPISPLTQSFSNHRKSSLKSRCSRLITITPARPDHYLARNSPEHMINDHRFSDESQRSIIDTTQEFKEFSEITKKLPRKNTKISLPMIQLESRYSDVVNAIFLMAHCNSGKIEALRIAQVFLELKFTSKVDSLVKIFKNIAGCKVFNSIKFTKTELMGIFCDQKVDKMLNALITGVKIISHHTGLLTLDSLLTVIEKWWDKITENSKELITVEEACSFLINADALDSANDALRLFIKFYPTLTYSQFSSVFGKSLLKFLMLQLIEVVDKKELKCVSPDILINAQKRRLILDSLKHQDSSAQQLNLNKLYNAD